MKVLFATIPQPKNRFVIDLKEGIESYAEVIYDYKEFWECKNSYDIVHIHEPEYLSYEVESCMYNTNPIPQDLWDRLIFCLQHWNKHSKIVHTRHVQEPHVRIDDEFRKLYKTVFSYCHGVAHFAGFSIQQFKEFYPEFSEIKHCIIPCHNYASLPNTISRREARKRLNIKDDTKVLLVFGMVKEREKPLIKTAYNAIPGTNKVLLAPGWKVSRRPIKWIRLREWVYKFDVWKARQNKQFRINLGFIEEGDAQYYCHASDVLLIPRMNELNSGNITFGFTFGLVVTGRDGGDIGEILKETGNPVFNPLQPASIANAVKKAFKLAEVGYGQNNKQLALERWSLKEVSKHYYNLYLQILDI